MNNTYVITDYGVIPNDTALQTGKIQAVLDLCKTGGGTVVIPAGTFHTGSLRLWSDTTVYLKSGANLVGSDEREDYEVYEILAGVELRSDMELIVDYYKFKPWRTYYRAILSAYGEKNIAVIGEEGSMIDGSNCYDPDGEEGYRGPHGMFITCCENVTLRGYTIGHCGNFEHEVNNCRNITMQNVTCLGGSDGIHLHCCTDILIADCQMKTGDDCIAGINVRNMHVRNCDLNTSSNFFRLGGIHILVEDCHMWGPGVYPWRRSVVKGKNDYLSREEGRHDTVALLDYFASRFYPDVEPSHDIVFRNCVIENLHRLLYYRYGGLLQNGKPFREWTFENVTFRNLDDRSITEGPAEMPLIIRMKNTVLEGGELEDLLNPNDTYVRMERM